MMLLKLKDLKKKIMEFNNEDNFMDFKEVKTFERMCSSLSDKKNFWQTKLDVAENELFEKTFIFTNLKSISLFRHL